MNLVNRTLVMLSLAFAACGLPKATIAPPDAGTIAEGSPSDRGLGTACDVGSTRACTCSASTGTQTCVSSTIWSECGCASPDGPDVLVPPAPPASQQCGGTQCAPYPLEDTEVGAKSCCTTAGTCGSSSDFLFGTACIARGGTIGQPSTQCPDEQVNFLDLEGCCRPDGACGLSVDAVTNFDLGCVERTQMQQLVNDGSNSRNRLSSVFFLPVKAASFPARACTFH